MKRLLPFLALSSLLGAGLARADDPAPPPTVITSGHLDIKSTDDETTFIFTELVTVTGNNISMTSDRLEAVALRSADQKKKNPDQGALGEVGKFKRMLATGRVKIEQGDRVATCGRAEVLPNEEQVILTEKPMVRDGESTVTGDRIRLLRNERRAIVESGAEGPARVTLPPIKDLGFQKDQPAPKKEHTPEPTPRIQLKDPANPAAPAEPAKNP